MGDDDVEAAGDVGPGVDEVEVRRAVGHVVLHAHAQGGAAALD